MTMTTKTYITMATMLCAHKTCAEVCENVALMNEVREHGVKETEKAFGGCKNCYGKGYNTVMQFAAGGSGKTAVHKKLPIMRFCRCERGTQLAAALES